MRVYGACKHCRHELQFRIRVETRVALAMQEGKYHSKTCKACGKNTTFFVNERYAKSSKALLLTAGLIFALGSGIAGVACYYAFLNSTNLAVAGCFGLLLIPGWAWFIIVKGDRDRVRAFNYSYIKQ